MIITKIDVIWSYLATFLKIASSVLLLPLILRMMPSEMVGIWTIFMTITALSSLLDFGFNPSFTRNVTFVFSGVKTLKINGFDKVDKNNNLIDYGLLKGLISAMRWFYLRMAFFLFLLLVSFGTYYIFILLQNYKGNHQEVYIAWVLLCIINTYNLYTLYYDALIQGKGLVKKSKQIAITGQVVYLMTAVIIILAGYGLVAIVSAQILSVIIIRWLSYYFFFTSEIKEKLHNAIPQSKKEILDVIYPNALKTGLTSLGSFLTQRSAIVIGSLYLSLEEIASYGITMQIIAIISSMASIYAATYLPQITQLWTDHDIKKIKKIYITGQVLQLMTYLICGGVLVIMGNWILGFIGSQTLLLSNYILIIALILSLEQTNLSIANVILLSRNEVPFYKSTIMSGLGTILGLYIAFHFTSIGVLLMVLVPLIVDSIYQGWKWPLKVKKELLFDIKDVIYIIKYDLNIILKRIIKK